MSKIKVACLLLCAGKSSRMSPDHKLLLKISDKTVLRKTAEEIVDSHFFEVIAVTGFQNELIEKELQGLSLEVVHNEHFERGLHSSIRVGALKLDAEADFFAVCLADQPMLSREDYNLLIKKAEENKSAKLIRPAFNGIFGNPTLISKTLIPEILERTDNDRGCSYLFERYPGQTVIIEMSDHSTLLDIDTPELFKDVKFHLEKRE